MPSPSTLARRLTRPVDGTSVAIVRIGLGLLIAIESAAYLAGEEIRRAFLDPELHFTWWGLDWVQPWAGSGMYVHFAVLGLLAVCLAAGVWHRIVAPLVLVGFAYVFLLDKTEYLNHFYAAILLLFLVALAPADRALSVAARRRPERPRTVPRWSVWILRFQVGVIYLYAGIAKLGHDWLLEGEPMGMWLADRSDLAILGPLLGASFAGLAFSWAGALYDLLIVPLLLWRRTRAVAYALAVLFNVTNWIVFDIGIFPPMMLVATTVFFEPDWPRRAWARIVHQGARDERPASPTASPSPPTGAAAPPPLRPWRSRLLVGGLCAYVAVQLLVPLRHHLYPGLVHWSEEGHRFAWHMKLRDKQGSATFVAVDRVTGEHRTLDPSRLVTARQHAKASVRPDMILQLAQALAEAERERGREVEVRARAIVSLNGRPARDLVDPERDLTQVRRGPWVADWIEPEPPRR